MAKLSGTRWGRQLDLLFNDWSLGPELLPKDATLHSSPLQL